jgi:autotransporter-associated beta strand protein
MVALPMKIQPIKVTNQTAKTFPGLLAKFIIAVLSFSVLPIARCDELYWSGDELYATPPVAGDGSWRNDPDAVNWSDKRTSFANISWIDGDVAHFLGSKGGTITLENNITAGGISFDSGASTFTIKTNGNVLTVQGDGIANESGKIQAITNNGEARGMSGGITIFSNFFSTSTAGDAKITNEGAAASATSIGASGGFTQFYNTSNAGKATIINNGSAAQATQGGITQFLDTSTAGSATITNNGANDGSSVSGTEPGATFFEGASSAGNATITNNGSPVSGKGGLTVFRSTSSAGSATIINNGSRAGRAGGITEFFDSSDGGTARAITNGNGRFDISGLSTTSMQIGSIEGSGNYFLGNKTLTVGGNNLSTTVSGVIQDGGIRNDAGGSLTKVGKGTLTLSGNNVYSGATTINGGTLRLGNGRTIPEMSSTTERWPLTGAILCVLEA